MSVPKSHEFVGKLLTWNRYRYAYNNTGSVPSQYIPRRLKASTYYKRALHNMVDPHFVLTHSQQILNGVLSLLLVRRILKAKQHGRYSSTSSIFSQPTIYAV